jgi:hypothetical protein
MKKQKINLIYIASNGRSGSTLLDMLIGKHNKCCTLGEFQILPIDLKHNTQPCGCGESVKECIFWSDIYLENKVILDSGSISRFRYFGAGKVLRWKELKDIFSNKKSKNYEIEQYGQENYIVLDAVMNKINKRKKINFLVDASKDPYRLSWLAQSGFFNISVLHIIKQPEAFVHSMQKQEKSKLKKLKITFRMSIRWILENSIIKKVCRKYISDDNYLKIRYEDLAQHTQPELKRIFSELGLQYDFDILQDGFFHENHAISGNQMRFKTSTIKLDEKWKFQLFFFQKVLIKAITYFHRKNIY